MLSVEFAFVLLVVNMVERKTIRPVTLRRVVEICSLASQSKSLNCEVVSQKLRVSLSRAKEILLEVTRMGLLSTLKDLWTANDRTNQFLEYFENEEWNNIHQYFLDNYQFYEEFLQVLQDHIADEHGLDIDAIIEDSIKLGLHLNKTAVEVLADWCERLGVIQRNLYTGRLYLVKDELNNKNEFLMILVKIYRKLSSSSWRKEVFVEIPLIREEMCERLKIARKIFDVMLKEIYLQNVGKIEFSSAPITTLAKKSPLGEKKMKSIGKDAIMSAKSTLQREREGLTINKKSYYYLAIHEVS
jgi:hypothetical protein